MKPVPAFFQLIRWTNLIIVFLTQWSVWWCAIVPMQDWNTVSLFLTDTHFVLLALSTVFIAAAGYIINDYFDVRIDIVNKPDKVIVEKIIKRRWAIIFHTAFNVIGIALASYLAYAIGNLWIVSMQLLCTVLLWFYSTHLKRQFISGNLAVALLSGFTVLILALFEPAMYPFIRKPYITATAAGNHIINPFWVILVYAYFAFMLTWMREIVKDMEDFKGDAEDGCMTMPIKIGLYPSAYVVTGLGILALIPLCIAACKLIGGAGILLGIYVIGGLIIPLCGLLIFLPRKSTSRHYAQASKWLKAIMVSGLIALLIYHFKQG